MGRNDIPPRVSHWRHLWHANVAGNLNEWIRENLRNTPKQTKVGRSQGSEKVKYMCKYWIKLDIHILAIAAHRLMLIVKIYVYILIANKYTVASIKPPRYLYKQILWHLYLLLFPDLIYFKFFMIYQFLKIIILFLYLNSPINSVVSV